MQAIFSVPQSLWRLKGVEGFRTIADRIRLAKETKGHISLFNNFLAMIISWARLESLPLRFSSSLMAVPTLA